MAAAWTSRKAMSTNKAAMLTSCVPAIVGVTRDDDKQMKRVPKGYLPIVLVRHDDDGGEGGAGTETKTEMRVLVRVRDLREPCMAALLEAAEEQFGYGQQGVLKVPCDARRFYHVVNMHGTQVVQIK